MGKVGLYEYLARPVGSATRSDSTHFTKADEPYDDDPGVRPMGHPFAFAGGTSKTFADSDTYDEDGQLGELGDLSVSTLSTRATADPYDPDMALLALGLVGSETTKLTEARGGDTYDDGASVLDIGSLGELDGTTRSTLRVETHDGQPGVASLGDPGAV